MVLKTVSKGFGMLLKTLHPNSILMSKQKGTFHNYFFKVLAEYVPRVEGYTPPENPRMLEIGYGNDPAVESLSRYFGKNGG